MDNGEGLGTVLQPHATRYSSVAFFNRDEMDGYQLGLCRRYLGVKKDALNVEFRKQYAQQDFKTYLSKLVKWPVPVLPSPTRCEQLRTIRAMYSCGRRERNTWVDCTPGTHIGGA